MPKYKVTEGEFAYKSGNEFLAATKGDTVEIKEDEAKYFDGHPTVKLQKLDEAKKEGR